MKLAFAGTRRIARTRRRSVIALSFFFLNLCRSKFRGEIIYCRVHEIIIPVKMKRRVQIEH